MNNDFLNQSVEFIKGVGPSRSKLLNDELNIKTVKDLIDFYPFRYIDRMSFFKINQLPLNNSEVQIIGKIKSIKKTKVRYRDRLNCEFYDETGKIDLIWYRGFSWVEESVKVDKEYVVYGKLNWYGNKVSIAHPEIKTKESFERNIPRRLHGIYSSTEKLIAEGVTQKYFVKIIFNLLNSIQVHIKENLSASILKEFSLIDRYQALINIHLPESQELLSQSIRRLKFEELFFNQIGFQLTKNDRIIKLNGFKFEKVGNNLNDFYNKSLPFELTKDQKKVIKEIRNDFRDGKQMNRLLQGDVGSGKTIVSLMVMLIAIDNGYQSCILAPTEILANQHYNSIRELIKDLDLEIELLTGSTKSRDRTRIHRNLKSGKINILIGTHAILEDIVQFNNLGLSVIDEQHRFGVHQRLALSGKGEASDVLVMTATPIPRTLTLTAYGDMDSSRLTEKPEGRQPIDTRTFPVERLDEIVSAVQRTLAQGAKIYWICPLVEESEALDLAAAEDRYAHLKQVFGAQVGLVHGKMKGPDKDAVMQNFAGSGIDILVATTVVEVGVDVREATVMVIEHAERFGLAQLHQLRGRIGRGAKKSTCMLLYGTGLSGQARERLKIMRETDDGFRIAEEDLRLRGAGELMGTRQSGLPVFKIADLMAHSDLLLAARDDAKIIIEKDPELQSERGRKLRVLLYLFERDEGVRLLRS